MNTDVRVICFFVFILIVILISRYLCKKKHVPEPRNVEYVPPPALVRQNAVANIPTPPPPPVVNEISVGGLMEPLGADFN